MMNNDNNNPTGPSSATNGESLKVNDSRNRSTPLSSTNPFAQGMNGMRNTSLFSQSNGTQNNIGDPLQSATNGESLKVNDSRNRSTPLSSTNSFEQGMNDTRNTPLFSELSKKLSNIGDPSQSASATNLLSQDMENDIDMGNVFTTDNPSQSASATNPFFADIHKKSNGTHHKKIKVSLISSMIAGGALVATAGVGYAFSDDIIKFVAQHGMQVNGPIPTTKPLPVTDIMPTTKPWPFDNNLPTTKPWPEGLDLEKINIEEINDIIMEKDGPFQAFNDRMVANGRLPADAALLPPIDLKPEAIIDIDGTFLKPDPSPITEELTQLKEFKPFGEGLEFLRDPAIMGGLAGGAAGIALLAVLIFALVKMSENKSESENERGRGVD